MDSDLLHHLAGDIASVAGSDFDDTEPKPRELRWVAFNTIAIRFSASSAKMDLLRGESYSVAASDDSE